MDQEEMKKFREDFLKRRDAFNKKMLELGFVAELAFVIKNYSGGGILFLRNDGTFWGDSNDGNVPGLDGTGLVPAPIDEVKIVRVTSLV